MPQNEYESVRKRTLSSAKLLELPHATNITIFYLIKRSFLFSLPHLVIIALFLIYNLLGAAILNEIETSSPVSGGSTIRDLRKEATKNVLIEKYQSEISEKSKINENLFFVLKQHTEKTFSNLEHFYTQVEQTIHETLNLSRSSDSSASNAQGLDQDDLETFAFFSRLYAKHKANMNIEKMFKTIAKHMVEFKARLKANLTNGIKEAVGELGSHQLRLNQELDKHLKSRVHSIEGTNSMDSAQFQQDNWKFSNYAYFIGSYLTTIGYGSISPKTIIGKMFTMIYLIFGLPLTLILLSDLGSLLTRLIKFTSTFAYTIYREGYYENLKSRLAKRRRALIDKLKSSTAHNKLKYKKRRGSGENDQDDELGSSSDDSQDEDSTHKPVSETSLWRSFLELGYRCMQQTNDEFDLSLGASIGFVLVYLTMGAALISRMSNCSIFNGYYSSLITLTKISYGDLLYNAENNEVQFTLVLAVYALLGMAFFDLTVLSLQEKMRLLLIKNARNILSELVKFANQLGYSSWTMESVNLENLGKNSIHKIFYRGPGIGQSLLDQDIDEVFYASSSGLKKGAPQKSALKSSKKKGHNDSHYHEITKCDKQTQITTLLCTKFKYGRQDSTNMNLSTGLSSSLGSIPESVVSMIEEEKKHTFVQPEITSHQEQINKTSIEVFQKDGNGNGNGSSKTPRRSRFASVNTDLSASVSYQKK